MSGRQREGAVEWLTHSFLAWVAVLIFAALICLFVALLFLFAAQPSLAQVTVPKECIELAAKYGRTIPAVMGKFKAAQVKAELKLLSDEDPMVKRCRDAVTSMEAKK